MITVTQRRRGIVSSRKNLASFGLSPGGSSEQDRALPRPAPSYHSRCTLENLCPVGSHEVLGTRLYPVTGRVRLCVYYELEKPK